MQIVQPSFLCTQMVNKQEQWKRRHRSCRALAFAKATLQTATRQKAHRPGRHPAHRRFHNTGSPIANRSTPPFLCTLMVNKQEQRKRRHRSERWRSPRPGNAPKGAPPSPASRPSPFSVLYYLFHYLLNVPNTHLVARRHPKRGAPCHCVAVSRCCTPRRRSSPYPCKRIGALQPQTHLCGYAVRMWIPPITV